MASGLSTQGTRSQMLTARTGGPGSGEGSRALGSLREELPGKVRHVGGAGWVGYRVCGSTKEERVLGCDGKGSPGPMRHAQGPGSLTGWRRALREAGAAC